MGRLPFHISNVYYIVNISKKIFESHFGYDGRMEEETLETLCKQVESGLSMGAQAVLKAGGALKLIRDRRLYPGTFEQFLADEFDLSRHRGYQLIYASELIEELRESFPDHKLPQSESAARPMVKLSKAQRVEVWRRALEGSKRSPGKALVEKTIAEVIQEEK